MGSQSHSRQLLSPPIVNVCPARISMRPLKEFGAAHRFGDVAEIRDTRRGLDSVLTKSGTNQYIFFCPSIVSTSKAPAAIRSPRPTMRRPPPTNEKWKSFIHTLCGKWNLHLTPESASSDRALGLLVHEPSGLQPPQIQITTNPTPRTIFPSPARPPISHPLLTT